MRAVADFICRLALISAAALLAWMMFLTCADVALRYLFNRPITGAGEGSQVAMAILIFSGVILNTRERRHISVAILEPILSGAAPRTYLFLQEAFNIVGVVALFYILTGTAIRFEASRHTSLVLGLDLWPVVAVMAGLCALAAAVACLTLGTKPAGEHAEVEAQR